MLAVVAALLALILWLAFIFAGVWLIAFALGLTMLKSLALVVGFWLVSTTVKTS